MPQRPEASEPCRLWAVWLLSCSALRCAQMSPLLCGDGNNQGWMLTPELPGGCSYQAPPERPVLLADLRGHVDKNAGEPHPLHDLDRHVLGRPGPAQQLERQGDQC
jgi:hypothetical protein